MNRAALMQRIEQHFGAKVARGTDLAVLMEDICCQVYQWGQEDAQAAAPAAPVAEPTVPLIPGLIAFMHPNSKIIYEDKHCFVQCPPERCDCKAGNPAAWATQQAAQPQPVAEQGVDDIVTALYRRFKEWSKRGFGPDDVTWCEVKADVVALIAASQQVVDDRRVADTVNAVRDIAVQFHAHQSLRERLATALVPALKAIQQPQDERAAFEAWASAPVRASKLPLDRWATNDGYVDQRTYTAFYGWQARAGLANKVAAPADNCDVCAGTGTAFGKTCNCQKGAAHG